MPDTQVSVSLPAESAALAGGLQKLFLDILAAKNGGATGVALVTAAVTAAIADLEPALAGVGALAGEAAAEPVGVAEAFALAGFAVVRALSNK